MILASAAIFGGRVFPSSPARSPAGQATRAHPHKLLSIPPVLLGVYPAGRGYGPIASFANAAGKRPDIRIAAGDYDGYLSSYAESVRAFGHAVIIGFGHEMNAPWYSWGYGHTSQATFVAAWRHIVKLFRALGADNVTWLWTINADQAGTGPLASWWPGAGYVTWVGIDGYYRRPSDTFAGVFGRTIDEARAFSSKPVLLSDTAIAPADNQVAKISDLFQGMLKYRTLRIRAASVAFLTNLVRDQPARRPAWTASGGDAGALGQPRWGPVAEGGLQQLAELPDSAVD